MEIARLSRDPLMRNIVALWDDLSEAQRQGTRLETLLDETGMAPEDFLAELVRAGHRSGVNQAAIVLGLATPLVAEAAVHESLKGSGFKDRRLIFQSSGLLPQSRNSFTAIRGNNVLVQQGAQPKDPGLPRLEEENVLDISPR